MPKYRMAEHKRRRLKHLEKELEKIVENLRVLNEQLEETYKRTDTIEALEYAYVKQLASIFHLLGADIRDVNLNPYGHNMPGITTN